MNSKMVISFLIPTVTPTNTEILDFYSDILIDTDVICNCKSLKRQLVLLCNYRQK